MSKFIQITRNLLRSMWNQFFSVFCLNFRYVLLLPFLFLVDVAFVGNLCPRINSLMNVYTCTNICLIFIKISRLQYQRNYVTTNQENFGYPRIWTPSIKWFHGTIFSKMFILTDGKWATTILSIHHCIVYSISFSYTNELTIYTCKLTWGCYVKIRYVGVVRFLWFDKYTYHTISLFQLEHKGILHKVYTQ